MFKNMSREAKIGLAFTIFVIVAALIGAAIGVVLNQPRLAACDAGPRPADCRLEANSLPVGLFIGFGLIATSIGMTVAEAISKPTDDQTRWS